LLGLCRLIEALWVGLPEREDLVLLWMMKHYDKEAAVPWKSAFTTAQKFAPAGQRIEYVIQALSKMYANPLAVSMAREALENFQWLPKTNVQVVQDAFAVLRNTYESAVEDTQYEVGLERVDSMSTKEWMLLLMKGWPLLCLRGRFWSNRLAWRIIYMPCRHVIM
jgi:hypothetical protein